MLAKAQKAIRLLREASELLAQCSEEANQCWCEACKPGTESNLECQRNEFFSNDLKRQSESAEFVADQTAYALRSNGYKP